MLPLFFDFFNFPIPFEFPFPFVVAGCIPFGVPFPFLDFFEISGTDTNAEFIGGAFVGH